MTKSIPAIENLMKVSLTIQTNSPVTDGDSGSPFTFIYGVGPGGITPFEKALYGKRLGDRIEFAVDRSTYCDTIGHLEVPIREQTGIHAPETFSVTISKIERAEDREVVKAMAAGGSCGDCDCGCGGH